jgi:hypothetical protein
MADLMTIQKLHMRVRKCSYTYMNIYIHVSIKKDVNICTYTYIYIYI